MGVTTAGSWPLCLLGWVRVHSHSCHRPHVWDFLRLPSLLPPPTEVPQRQATHSSQVLYFLLMQPEGISDFLLLRPVNHPTSPLGTLRCPHRSSPLTFPFIIHFRASQRSHTGISPQVTLRCRPLKAIMYPWQIHQQSASLSPTLKVSRWGMRY